MLHRLQVGRENPTSIAEAAMMLHARSRALKLSFLDVMMVVGNCFYDCAAAAMVDSLGPLAHTPL